MSILKELDQRLPKDASISEVKFEGSEIVLYTKNKDFFKKSEHLIKDIVRSLKKRVEIRPDMSITMDMEKAKKAIEKIVPESAGIKAIYFEPELGKVVVEGGGFRIACGVQMEHDGAMTACRQVDLSHGERSAAVGAGAERVGVAEVEVVDARSEA